MTISLSGISGSQQQQTIQNASAKLQAAIASIVSGNRITQASDDVAALSIAGQLQSETSGLKQISGNIAQASSMTQVAEGGVSQIQTALTQLQSLASQAGNPTLNAENRKQLNQQFQALTKEIDQLAGGTSFNNQKLLNGDLSGDNALSLDRILSGDNGGNDVEVTDLSSSSLFSGKDLNLLTAENAQEAFSVVGDALNQVTSVRASLGSFQQTLNFAAANVDSAIVNQEAARSELTDTDLAVASTDKSLADIQRNAGIALAAQTNRLSPKLLQLIS